MSLFTDLKNRRVFQVAGIYVAVAWGATEILIEVIDRLGLPDYLATLVVIMFVLGFPVAVFLAWVFDVTPEGIRRTEPGTTKSVFSVGLAVTFLFAGTAGLYYFLDSRTEREALRSQALILPLRSIAVLPFESADASETSTAQAVGLVDELLARFSVIPDLKVTARASSFSGQLEGLDARQIGQRLGVRQLLQGSLRSAGQKLRVNSSLIDTISGYQIWAGTLDVSYAENFSLAAKLADSVIRAMELSVSQESLERATHVRPANPRAFDLYLLGRQRLRDQIDDNSLLAVRYFEEALALDPNFAKAQAGLAEALPSASLFLFIPPEQAMGRAREAALRAIALDDSLAEAHLSLAAVEFGFSWDWAAAGREFRRVLTLAPGNVDALAQYAYFLSFTGEHDSAIETMRRVAELDPLTADVQLQIGWLLNYARRFEEALAQFEAVADLMPDNATVYMETAWPLVDLDRRDEALAAVNRSLELAGNDLLVTSGNAWTLARLGERERALELLQDFHELGDSGYADPIVDAVIYLALGDKEKGLAYIEQMIEDRSGSVIFLTQGKEFDPIRDDPRFHALLEEIGLAQWAILKRPP